MSLKESSSKKEVYSAADRWFGYIMNGSLEDAIRKAPFWKDKNVQEWFLLNDHLKSLDKGYEWIVASAARQWINQMYIGVNDTNKQISKMFEGAEWITGRQDRKFDDNVDKLKANCEKVIGDWAKKDAEPVAKILKNPKSKDGFLTDITIAGYLQQFQSDEITYNRELKMIWDKIQLTLPRVDDILRNMTYNKRSSNHVKL